MQNMRKKIFLIGGGSALLLLCMIVGAFFAGPLLASAHGTQSAVQATSTPASTNYCQQYLQDLAQRLNVSVAIFEHDRTAAKEDMLVQLVKDGKLTQAQANAIKQRMASHQVCSGKGQGAGLERNILRLTLMQYCSTLLNQIAQGLHLSTTQLQADLQKGRA